MSINRGLDKEDVIYKCTKEYYSAIKRNVIIPFAEMWMDLGTVIQSDVRRNIILIHLCGIQKNGVDEGCLQSRNRDTDIENKCMDAKGGRGVECGTWRLEIGMGISALPCVKQTASEGLQRSGPRAVWRPAWDGNPKEMKYVCKYS